MGNITYGGQIDLHDLKHIDLTKREMDKYTVVSGDVLFNRTNSPDLVGKTAVYTGSARLAFAGYLVRLRTNSRADPYYISFFLNLPYSKKTLRGMCKSIIGMANINSRELQTIAIPVPPLALQQAFAARIRALRNSCHTQELHLTKLDILFSSLQQRAFRGELQSKPLAA